MANTQFPQADHLHSLVSHWSRTLLQHNPPRVNKRSKAVSWRKSGWNGRTSSIVASWILLLCTSAASSKARFIFPRISSYVWYSFSSNFSSFFFSVEAFSPSRGNPNVKHLQQITFSSKRTMVWKLVDLLGTMQCKLRQWREFNQLRLLFANCVS